MAKSTGCPICARPVSPAHLPFCSRGCRDRDLLQWLGEGYRLPAGPADIAQDERAGGVDSNGDGD